MSVASIVCVDGELDVHDTASAAVQAAIQRRRDAPTARIGVAIGELEIGDPLGFAKRLVELAEPGAILVTDAIRRAVAPATHVFVDLGAISSAGYLERVHVFELDGKPARTRTVLALELRHVGRVREANEAARVDAENRAYDRRVWAGLAKHRGYVERSITGDYLAAFERPLDAFRAAVALIRDLDQLDMRVLAGIERGDLVYTADRWVGEPWRIAEHVVRRYGVHLCSTMTAIEAVGHAALASLGLVIEAIEEQVDRGVRSPVRVALLQMT